MSVRKFEGVSFECNLNPRNLNNNIILLPKETHNNTLKTTNWEYANMKDDIIPDISIHEF